MYRGGCRYISSFSARNAAELPALTSAMIATSDFLRDYWLLLIIGIFIARRYTLRAKLVTAFLVIVLTSLGVLAVLDGHIMSESLTEGANKSLASAAGSNPFFRAKFFAMINAAAIAMVFFRSLP